MATVSHIICIIVLASLLVVERSRAECDFGCGHYYKPICARDVEGNTREFANDCDLSWARCKTPTKKYEVVKKGQCEDKEEKVLENVTEQVTEKV